MIYVQQVRSRKESLVPIRNDLDSDVKIEIVDVTSLNGIELISMDSDQFIEVVTSPSTPESSNGGGDTPRPRKRAKLDHMTSEEKAQHRKMMNRISAQSARDRQKAFISEQEKTIRRLVSDNESLKEQNHTLTSNNDKLTEENTSLRAMVEDLEKQLKKMSSKMTEVKVKVEPSSIEEKPTSCCGPSEPAEGDDGLAADVSFPPRDVGGIPIDFDSPDFFEALEAFSKQILSPDSNIVNLEQIATSESCIGETSSQSKMLDDNESRHTWINNLDEAMDLEAATEFTSDSEDDTNSNSESSLPLVEPAFGLLPIPVSPSVPITSPIENIVDHNEDKKSAIVLENFDNCQLFWDSGCEIIASWDAVGNIDEPLFPDLTLE